MQIKGMWWEFRDVGYDGLKGHSERIQFSLQFASQAAEGSKMYINRSFKTISILFVLKPILLRPIRFIRLWGFFF